MLTFLCYTIRSFVQPIDDKNTLRFLSLSVRLLATALANSPLRGSNKAPQLQLAQTNFTKTCYHFCHSTVGRRICKRIASRKWALGINCTWGWCFRFSGTKTGAILDMGREIWRLGYNLPFFCSIICLKSAIRFTFWVSDFLLLVSDTI